MPVVIMPDGKSPKRPALFDQRISGADSGLTEHLTIAVDGMGGDNAPDAVIHGAHLACAAFPNARFLIFGDQDILQNRIAEFPGLGAVSEIRHTDQIIKPEDKPGQAMRRGRGSSMGLAIEAVRSGEASVAVSGGNTGALMAMSKFALKTMPGIDRPALASTVPTQGEDLVMLDLGANVDCTDDNLFQFAIMGAEFARTVLDRERPVVGLLNVGVEELKGNEAVRSAGERLRDLDGSFEFGGFVEGDNITKGDMDVIVTDGFTGNIAIKTVEGTARMFGVFLARAFRSSFQARLGYLAGRKALANFRERIDPRGYNGGVFLGLNGLIVKSHGGTDEKGFAAAIALAVRMAAADLSNKIRDDLREIEEAGIAEAARRGVGE